MSVTPDFHLTFWGRLCHWNLRLIDRAGWHLPLLLKPGITVIPCSGPHAWMHGKHFILLTELLVPTWLSVSFFSIHTHIFHLSFVCHCFWSCFFFFNVHFCFIFYFFLFDFHVSKHIWTNLLLCWMLYNLTFISEPSFLQSFLSLTSSYSLAFLVITWSVISY